MSFLLSTTAENCEFPVGRRSDVELLQPAVQPLSFFKYVLVHPRVHVQVRDRVRDLDVRERGSGQSEHEACARVLRAVLEEGVGRFLILRRRLRSPYWEISSQSVHEWRG